MTKHIFGSGFSRHLSLRDCLFNLWFEEWRCIILGSAYLSLIDCLFDLRIKEWRSIFLGLESGFSRYLSLRDSGTFVPSSFIFQTSTCDQICSFQLPFEFFNMMPISEATRSKIVKASSFLVVFLVMGAIFGGSFCLILFSSTDFSKELVKKWFASLINNDFTINTIRNQKIKVLLVPVDASGLMFLALIFPFLWLTISKSIPIHPECHQYQYH